MTYNDAKQYCQLILDETNVTEFQFGEFETEKGKLIFKYISQEVKDGKYQSKKDFVILLGNKEIKKSEDSKKRMIILLLTKVMENL